MNWLDLVIILVLITAIGRGLRFGFLQLALSFAGFVIGILLGSWIASNLIGASGDPLTKVMLIIAIELFAAFSLSFGGEVLGVYLGKHVHKIKAAGVNQALGAVFEIIGVLVIFWLLASALANTSNATLGPAFRRSAIVRALNRSLPPPPDVIARLEKIVSPNGFPNVFIGLEPQHTTISPKNTVNNQKVLQDEKSVVKIEGRGCGGIVDGSGFVVAKNIVLTNAHVIAGIPNPEVIDSIKTYRATPIWFDPNLDLALLRVNNLPDSPLTISPENLGTSDASVALGFPGGGPLVASEGVIIDQVTARGRNIYNRGIVYREIYEVQAEVEPGNSGGPLVGPDGSVAGIVFAKSVSQDKVSYSLVGSNVKSQIEANSKKTVAVDTGSCAAD
jgi:S1-C subfamily serine protease